MFFAFILFSLLQIGGADIPITVIVEVSEDTDSVYALNLS